MAAFGDIEIKMEVRPCYVENKKALFHSWIRKKNLLYNDEYIMALVEFEDGSLEEITYNKIKFIDNKHKEYNF